jgi:DNA-directed RNA polymerase subunit N (RpoN/RPB10)
MATVIPIKCFTCGQVIADKWRYYNEEVKRRKMAENPKHIKKVEYLKSDSIVEKSIEGQVLDKLSLTSVCCRRHLLSHVDIV